MLALVTTPPDDAVCGTLEALAVALVLVAMAMAGEVVYVRT